MTSHRQYRVEDYVDGILSGDRVVLSRAITLVESTKEAHREEADEIIEKCLPHAGNSIRIGITGIPGVGKSTFIDVFGNMLTGKGRKVAVLAVDPSSIFSKGSVLGDKTRMTRLAADSGVYIRPSPAAGSPGGVARRTREAILLCEAAGFDTILVETVGVGQAETTVYSMVDFFLLLAITGAGDELQGIKRGIIEMSHAIAITKADGENEQAAHRAQIQYQNAIKLFSASGTHWQPVVFTCSALNGSGFDRIWTTIQSYVRITRSNDLFQNNRRQQAKNWMYQLIEEQLNDRFYSNEAIHDLRSRLVESVINQEMSPRKAANLLLEAYP